MSSAKLISVRRNRNCLEISIAQESLKICRRLSYSFNFRFSKFFCYKHLYDFRKFDLSDLTPQFWLLFANRNPDISGFKDVMQRKNGNLSLLYSFKQHQSSREHKGFGNVMARGIRKTFAFVKLWTESEESGQHLLNRNEEMIIAVLNAIYAIA